MNASNFIKATWFILFPGTIAAIFGIRKFLKTDTGRRRWDRIKLRLPMKIGDVVRKITMARFSRTLSTLVAAGVDIIKALEITGQTAGNWVVEDALAGVRQKVGEGVPIAQPLIENPVFPAMVSQMVKIGEETGELEKMLSKIADFYEEEVDVAVAGLLTLLEPLMIALLGGIVGGIVIAMYLPIFSLINQLTGGGG
jgi:type IV pilus assembly protein PilC